jgi:hypothetical protein
MRLHSSYPISSRVVIMVGASIKDLFFRGNIEILPLSTDKVLFFKQLIELLRF